MSATARRLARIESVTPARCPHCDTPQTLTASPEWRAVVGALRQHPDAALAVSRALRDLGQTP
jgi:hypothetical protein